MFNKASKKSKAFALLLATALVLGLLPAAVYAADVVEYGLWVGGDQVTSENLSGSGWSYEGNASKGTLTLTNANITGSYTDDYYGNINIYNSGISDLTIELVGKNYLSGAKYGICSELDRSSLTITGSGGSLDVKGIRNAIHVTVGVGSFSIVDTEVRAEATGDNSGNGSGIDCVGNVSISGSKLTAIGTGDSEGIYTWDLDISDSVVEAIDEEGFGIIVDGISSKKLRVSGSSLVTAIGKADTENGFAAVKSWGGFEFGEGIGILEPADHELADLGVYKVIADTDGNYAEKVIIGQNYPLWVGGSQVTELNADDLTVIEGVDADKKGARYDPETGTLYLDSVSITGKSEAGDEDETANIFNAGIEDFTIELTGENYLSGADNGIVTGYDCTSFTIRGGSLDARGSISGISANVMDGTFKIEDAQIRAEGTAGGSIGIKCYGNLSISGSKVTAVGVFEDGSGRGISSWNFEIDSSHVEADCPGGVGILVYGGYANKLVVSGESFVKATGAADMNKRYAALMSNGGLDLKDDLVVISPENYTMVNLQNTISAVGDSEGKYVDEVIIGRLFSVEVIPGEGMEITDGEAEQGVQAEEEMEPVVLSAAEGHYFPEDYGSDEMNGIEITRNDYTQITVSGIPTADAEIELPDASLKTKEETPEAVFEADGYDSGILRGLEPGMTWQIDGGESALAMAEEVELTELEPCEITIIKPASDTDTMLDSEPQMIEITRAEKPELTPVQPATEDEKGSIPTEKGVHEFSEDGQAWILCSGAAEDLDAGTYYVRTTASGTVLASEAQEIEIKEFVPDEPVPVLYTIKITGGTTDKTEAEEGETVTITADKKSGQTFKEWKVVTGGAIITSPGAISARFMMPAANVEIEALFKKKTSGGSTSSEPAKKPRHPFVDVANGVWYDEAVQWAWENRITDGVDDTHFAPNATATRAQMVTFLWRAAGSPKAGISEIPFADTVKGSWYYDALLWAYEKGITDGTSETTFSPGLPVTRSMVAAFLYRYEKSLGGGFKDLWAFELDYSDVSDVPEYAYEPFCWLVKEGVIEGSNGRLIPLEPCLRSQIVTMMQRYFSL